MPDFISNVNSENVNTKLQRSMEKLKKFATKNYGRITETKWTLFFLIASTIQAFLAIILEARILARNSNAQYIVSTLPSMQKPCERNTINRMSNIRGENVIFILFNIFQLWFSYNAIYNQNVIQLVTIAGVNYSVGILAIVQIIEINKWKSEAMACFPSYMFDNQFARYEVPLIIISLMSATTMVYFTWKLYQQFGWNIYKKIGADLKMQSIYKTMLIFVMFLKLDIFFMIVMAIEASTAFKTVPESPTDPRYLNPGIYWFHVCVTIIIVFLLALAFHSFRRESDIGMKIFIATWLITIIDFIILLKFSIKSASEDSWFFFICYIVFGIVMSLFTFLWSIFVLRNFGLGLKKHLSCESKDSTLPQHTTQLPSTFRDQQILDPFEVPPIPNNTNENNNVRINAPMRWAIDDD